MLSLVLGTWGSAPPSAWVSAQVGGPGALWLLALSAPHWSWVTPGPGPPEGGLSPFPKPHTPQGGSLHPAGLLAPTRPHRLRSGVNGGHPVSVFPSVNGRTSQLSVLGQASGGLPPGQWSGVNRRPGREGGRSPSRASSEQAGSSGCPRCPHASCEDVGTGGPNGAGLPEGLAPPVTGAAWRWLLPEPCGRCSREAGDSRAGPVDQPLRLGPRGGHGQQGALRDHLQSSLPGPPGGGRPGRSLGTGCPHAEASGVPRAPDAAIGVTLPVKDRASYGLVLPQDRLTGQGATAPPDPIRDPASSSSGPRRAAPPPCL